MLLLIMLLWRVVLSTVTYCHIFCSQPVLLVSALGIRHFKLHLYSGFQTGPWFSSLNLMVL